MTLYRIRHVTEYNYEDAASLSYNQAFLLPRAIKSVLYTQQVVEARLETEPQWDDYREREDFYGNRAVYYTVRQPHEHVAVTARSQVQIEPQGYIDPIEAERMAIDLWLRENASTTAAWETVAQQIRRDRTPSGLDARQFTLPSPYIPQIEAVGEFAKKYFSPKRPVVEAGLALMEAIFTEFDFVPDATDIATPLSEVIEKRQGVCQDFAHLMIAALRYLGLPARYMSGYIETLPPPGEIKLEGADASHAWCSLYVPSLGWLDLDPTNNLLPTDQHVILAWGRDFGDVSPIKGVYYGGGEQTLDVSVDMKRIT